LTFDPAGYSLLDERMSPHGRVSGWVSRDPSDDRQWDDFLRASGVGQYQQAAFWMRARRAQGWRPIRTAVTVDGELAGGFQILWRSTVAGRAAYISKRPVVHGSRAWLADDLLDLMRAVSRADRLRMLVVQPPDLDRDFAARLETGGFLKDVFFRFNTATWVVDVRGGVSAIEKGMNRSTRQNVRQAEKSGVSVREGTRSDLAAFFQMMLTTCQRQGVKPHPSSLDELHALWDAAWPGGSIRLTIAERERKPIAGLIALIFGRTVTFWRKGWTSGDGSLHPNELLMHEALIWSHQAGHHLCDYAALDRSIAVAMLSGQALNERQKKSRHLFNIRLGGLPRLVPEARVYLPGAITRAAYRIISTGWRSTTDTSSAQNRAIAASGSHAG